MFYLKLICATSATIVPLIISRHVIKYYKKLSTQLKAVNDTDEYTYKCTFVDFNNTACLRHITVRTPCSPICSYQHILDLIEAITSAKHSILLCMYHLTFMEFAEAFMKMHKKGVKIRCITDSNMSFATSTKIKLLKKIGIPIKMPTSINSMMHHKFIVIDPDSPTEHMVFGSANYTLQAFAYNWDHLIYTNNKEISKIFREEFEEMWAEL